MGRLESRAIREPGDLPECFAVNLRGKVESYFFINSHFIPDFPEEVGDFLFSGIGCQMVNLIIEYVTFE